MSPILAFTLRFGLSVTALLAWIPRAIAAEAPEDQGTDKAGNSEHDGGLTVTLYADPLGFALLGPSLGAELGSGHFAGRLYGRWMNAGLLSQALFSNDAARATLVFSYGGGLRGRYYLAPDGNSLYFGAGLEYLRTRIEDTEEDREAYLSSYWIPHVDGGYRIALGRLFIGAGAGLGYAITGSTETVDLSNGEDPELLPVSDESKPYGAVYLDVGVTF